MCTCLAPFHFQFLRPKWSEACLVNIIISILNSKALIVVSYAHGCTLVPLSRRRHLSRRTAPASIQRFSQSLSVKNRRLEPYLPKALPQPFPRKKVHCSGIGALERVNHCPFFSAPLLRHLPSREPASGLARTLKSHSRYLQCAVVHLLMGAHIPFSCRPGFE